MDIIDLSWTQLAIAFVILLLPAWIFWKYRTGLNKKLLTASIRMVLQLLFVGYYLEYLFEYDNPWIMIIVIVADFATIDRSELKQKMSLLIPIFASTFFGIVVIDHFFLEAVIQLPKFLAAQYTIPITGIGVRQLPSKQRHWYQCFYYSLSDHKERYQFYLACGA